MAGGDGTPNSGVKIMSCQIFSGQNSVTLAGVSGPKTRAVDNGWNADRIGVMVVDAPGTTTTMGGKYKNVGYATTSTGTNADFTPMTAGGGIFFEDAFLEFTFAAYAPYASGTKIRKKPQIANYLRLNI